MASKMAYLPHCEVCNRVMNDTATLTDMWESGELKPLRICAAGYCWGTANSKGYWSRYQIETK
jgi:hypothetical protein